MHSKFYMLHKLIFMFTIYSWWLTSVSQWHRLRRTSWQHLAGIIGFLDSLRTKQDYSATREKREECEVTRASRRMQFRECNCTWDCVKSPRIETDDCLVNQCGESLPLQDVRLGPVLDVALLKLWPLVTWNVKQTRGKFMSCEINPNSEPPLPWFHSSNPDHKCRLGIQHRNFRIWPALGQRLNLNTIA